MNRTPLSHRVAMLAVVAVLACGWLRTANAQYTAPASPPQIFKVYRLRYVSPSFASSALNLLMDRRELASMKMIAGDGTLLMFAPTESYKKIDEVLKAIDVAPIAPIAEPETQIKVFSLVDAEPASVANVLGTLLPKDARRAVDERTRSVVISGSRGAIDIAEAVVRKLDEEATAGRPKHSANYDVRILWLANDDKGAPPADDLKDVVAELSRLGVKDVRQVGQMVVQTSSGGTFQLSSQPDFMGQPDRLTAAGRLLEQSDGSLEMYVSIKARKCDAQQEQQNLAYVDTRIVVPQKQYVVLATAPVGNMTSVFVVQVTGRPNVGERK